MCPIYVLGQDINNIGLVGDFDNFDFFEFTDIFVAIFWQISRKWPKFDLSSYIFQFCKKDMIKHNQEMKICEIKEKYFSPWTPLSP